jgi:hypothetical protein
LAAYEVIAMSRAELMEKLRRDGRFNQESCTHWAGMADLLSVFDAIGRDGTNAIVKIDGARGADCAYTVLVSGGRLGDSFFRKDGASLPDLLVEAIEFYDANGWANG